MLIPILCLVLIALCAFAPPVSAATECGKAAATGGAIVKGALTLNETTSTVSRKFGRSEGTRTFQLIYDVAGCEIATKPEVVPGPLKDVDEEIPTKALGKPTITARGDEIKVIYKVPADAVHPGTYGSLIEVSDPRRLRTVRTPIALSRSERWFLVPGGIGFVAGALGFVLLYQTKRLSRYRIIVSKRSLWTAFFAACGAGAVVAIFNWLDQEVWVWQTNWKVAAATAFGQSTAGVMAALLAGVFSEGPDPEPAPPGPAPAPPSPAPAPPGG